MTSTRARERTPRAARALTGPQKWVVSLGILVLILGLANLGRACVALSYGARLRDLRMTVSWTYLVAVGIFWGLALTVCSAALMRFRRWGRRCTLAAVTLYQVHVWVNHLLFDANFYARQTRPRDLVLTVLFLALTWGVLNLSAVRRVF